MSQLGSTSIILQFDLDRDIDGAARDVQAAINAARGQLPTNLPTNPTWRKVNPAELRPSGSGAHLRHGHSSRRCTTWPTRFWRRRSRRSRAWAQVNDGRQLARPAVRAEVNPLLLSKLGIGLDQVRNALECGQCSFAQGLACPCGNRSFLLNDNDQLYHRQRICAADRRL